MAHFSIFINPIITNMFQCLKNPESASEHTPYKKANTLKRTQ